MAAPAARAVRVITDGCSDAAPGVPALLPLGRDLLVTVHGKTCGWVTLVDGRTGAERKRFANGVSQNVLRGDPYGTAVALQGRRLLVGAPQTVYALDPRTGVIRRTYKNPANSFGNFGSAVVAAGRHVVVGAPYTGLTGDGVVEYGAVLVFDAARGTLERTVSSPSGSRTHAFGQTLSRIDDRRVAVGTLNAADGRAGLVHVLDAATGTIERTLSTPRATGYYNGGVATTRTLVVVGAPGNAGPTPGGTVYVFAADDGHIVRTIANPGAATQAFGAALAIRGRQLLVLAPVEENDDTRPAGTVYRFDLRTGRLRGQVAVADDTRSGQLGSIAFLRRGFVLSTLVFGRSDELGIDLRPTLPR
jgi:outer membrane protein assembly factor BamB